ncbi:MAG TPA: hypothetical protein VLT85_10950 [Terriglobales bacterium]|nr:hypothetical protein [Terriglobales bacterium]
MRIWGGVRGPGRRERRRQQGYVLLVILLMLALLMIALVAVAPRIIQQIRREREEETIHRGTQYVRAIRLFYRKFGRYPTSLKELEGTNNIRFLRKQYKDPLSPNGEWRIIHLGEAKVIPTGFQPSPGTTPGQPGTGTGTSETPGQPSAPAAGSEGAPASSGSSSGSAFGGGAIVGVAPLNNGISIKELNGKSHYNEWEFVYDPRLDLTNRTLVLPGGVPAGAPGTPQPGPGQPGPPPGGPVTPPPMNPR